MKFDDNPKLLYAWYGDDFTGSTDVLEALGLHGVPAVLFTRPPSGLELASFPQCRAFGIAGESRSRTPAWMDGNLPAIFAAMRALGAAVNHYKVCSTFDSSPQTGSIGRALELGAEAFRSSWVPVVAAAPRLGRFVLFSNLFASAQGEIYRIDRHPTMSFHPVTPMEEADLRKHLARQTDLPVGSVDLRDFQSGKAKERLRCALAAGSRAIVFDSLDSAMLEDTAALLSMESANRQVFGVGSSGLTYGLLGYWRRKGWIGDVPALPAAAPTDRLLVVSGSCSPATARQIHAAREQGFASFHMSSTTSWKRQTENAISALAGGKSVVLYSALGSADQTKNYGTEYGHAFGEAMREILLRSGVRRAVIAGGDTSTHTVGRLGLSALTFAAPLTPGAPLCRAWAPGSPLDGLELVLKGGQIGPEDFFARVRDGMGCGVADQ